MDINSTKKLKGKFFKKDSFISGIVKIQKFSFSEIRKHDVLYADNPSQNIYFKDLQQAKKLESVVKNSARVFEDLQDNLRPGIIYPRDFTDDWIEEKRKLKKRSAHKEYDDDEFEMVLEEEARNKSKNHSGPEHNKKDQDIVEKENKKNIEMQTEDNKNLQSLQDVGKVASFEDMGNAIKSFSHKNHLDHETSTSDDATEIIEPNTSPAGQENDADVQDSAHIASRLENEQHLKQDRSHEAIDKTLQDSPALAEAPSQDHVDQQINEQDLERIKEESYQEGLEKGGEKAEAEVKDLIDNFTKNLNQLQTLKQKILQNSQDNFAQISSAISEALIGKAIDVDPNIFKNIIEKAISDSMNNEKFTVKIHPDLLESLKKHHQNTLEEYWVEDPSLEPGQFVVESNDTKISSNLKEIISSMLKDVDINLFEDESMDSEKTE